MCDTIFKKDIFFFFRMKTAGIRVRGGPRVEQDPTARYCGPRGSRAPAPPPHELPVPAAPGLQGTAEGQARFCYRSLANFTKVSKFGKVSPKFLYKKATVIVGVRTR